jgi:uncharacterized membrane protein YoaK (UPF0700 family)
MPYARPDAVPERPTIIRARPIVTLGGAALAGLAGYVNAVVLGYFHVPVSHMTGAVSRLGTDLATRQHQDLVVTLGIVAGFLCGAVLSGAVIGATQLRPGRRYGAVLVLEAVLLVAATLLLLDGRSSGVPLAAMACGLQNAMASSYFGLVIRTTHVTGIVTDIGVILGHWLRYRRVARWKLLLLGSILLSFFLGALAGTVAATAIGMRALLLAAAACAIGGTAYGVWAHRQPRAVRARAERVERMRALSDADSPGRSTSSGRPARHGG